MAKPIKPSKEGFSLVGAILLLIAYKFFIGMIVSFIVTIAGAIILESYTLSQQQFQGIAMVFLNRLFLYSIINVAVILCMYKSAKNRGLDRISYIGNENLQAYTLVMLTILGYILFFHNTIDLPLRGIEASGNLMEDITQNPIIMFLVVVIMAPLFEEILYRGIILEGFLKRHNKVQSIVFSSIIFSLVHLNLHQSLNAFLIGLILGFIYVESKSVVLCTAAHGFNNLFFYLVTFQYIRLSESFNIIQLLMGGGILIGIGMLYKSKPSLFIKSKSSYIDPRL